MFMSLWLYACHFLPRRMPFHHLVSQVYTYSSVSAWTTAPCKHFPEMFKNKFSLIPCCSSSPQYALLLQLFSHSVITVTATFHCSPVLAGTGYPSSCLSSSSAYQPIIHLTSKSPVTPRTTRTRADLVTWHMSGDPELASLFPCCVFISLVTAARLKYFHLLENTLFFGTFKAFYTTFVYWNALTISSPRSINFLYCIQPRCNYFLLFIFLPPVAAR